MTQTLVGSIVGHFTTDEYASYRDREHEVRHRLTTLVVRYVLDA